MPNGQILPTPPITTERRLFAAIIYSGRQSNDHDWRDECLAVQKADELIAYLDASEPKQDADR